MWKYNRKSLKWERGLDSLNVNNFNFYKQELEKIRYYSKCLDGTSYTRLNDFESIYDILLYKENDLNWIVNSSTSPYSTSSSTYSLPITSLNYTDYENSNREYSYTLKNLFTPKRVIDDLNKNYYYVDVATIDEIDLNQVSSNYIIDGVRLLVGHRVLVKNQVTFETIANYIDPEVYFTFNYYISTKDSTTVTYYYYNDTNGIYEYRNNRLNLLTDLDEYDNALKYSIAVKLGTNREKQYHLSRLKNGQFPISTLSQNFEFLEKHNWILRNRVEYQDIYDLDYNDILNSPTQSYGTNSIIPYRQLFVGEYGSILNLQNGYLSNIQNKYKSDLKSISRTSTSYWCCGMDGLLLKIDKLTLEITKVELNTRNTLNNIEFYNDYKGVVVGDFNTIYYTLDGGINWKSLFVEEFNDYDYRKVLFKDQFNVYIGGSNGFFGRMSLSSGLWTLSKIDSYRIIDEDTIVGLIDNINDMILLNNLSWNLTYSTSTTNSITSSKDAILVVGDLGLSFIHDLNNFSSQYSDIYINWTNPIGDIKSLVKNGNEFYLISDYVNTFSLGDAIISSVSNVISYSYSNYIQDNFIAISKNTESELLIVGSESAILTSLTSASYSYVDESYYTEYRSKLLFLDYDVASKLNFFDKDHNYRLPELDRLIATSGTSLTTSFISIDNRPNEYNWLSYYKDSIKEFNYNSANYSDITKVEFSSIFNRLSVSESNIVTISATSGMVTNDLIPIIDLAPTLNGYISGATALTGSTYSYNLFLYDDIMILHHTSSLTSSIGDVFYLDSNVVSDKFILNNKLVIGSSEYLYFNTDFNQNITNNLVRTTYSISLLNTNYFSTDDEFFANFNDKHFINWGYGLTISSSSSNIEIDVYAKYNNHTAYYNMSSEIIFKYDNLLGQNTSTYSLSYNDLYLNFGFTPTFNLEDYLYNIDSINFTSSKVFEAMPSYVGIPVGTSNTYANITGNINGYYKISMNPTSLQLEYDTILINTFIDLNITDGFTTVTTEKLLVRDKYTDEDTGYLILEFNKEIQTGSLVSFTSIDILSRSTLSQVSLDLQELNNIHLSSRLKEYGLNSYNTLENEIRNRFYTDSYAKILLSDSDIKNSITAILFYDYKNELSLNLINAVRKITSNIVRTYSVGLNLGIELNEKHNLKIGDHIFVKFTGTDVFSSGYSNPSYNGFRVVASIIDDYNLELYQSVITTYTSDPGYIEHFIYDPYFNYEAVDILDIGIDKKSKQSILINPINVSVSEDTTSLINIDFSKYRFRMVDGLNLITLSQKYPWVLEAEIEGAVIGEDQNGLVWYTGIWLCGRWFGGTWYSGEWRGGTWYGGTWYSNSVDIKGLNAKVNLNIQNNQYSIWFDGDWIDGKWNAGLWFGGEWREGTWNTGEWFDGTWNDGIWNAGLFKGGTWIDGKWYSGEFSSDSNQAYWLNGEFNGGDFANGIWYNGSFDKRSSTLSRFGTRASNERKAIWYGGNWVTGEFHSFLNQDIDGNNLSSNYNGYSIWYSGKWNNGIFYGGTIYNIDFKLGSVLNCVLYPIKITNIQNNYPNLSSIDLEGVYYFNRGNVIWIIDNNNSSYSYIGELSNQKSYIIEDITVDELNNKTTIYINLDSGSSSPINTDTNNRVVSYFSNCKWFNGIWFNGIFDGDIFYNGIWYSGVFKKGTWLI